MREVTATIPVLHNGTGLLSFLKNIGYDQNLKDAFLHRAILMGRGKCIGRAAQEAIEVAKGEFQGKSSCHHFPWILGCWIQLAVNLAIMIYAEVHCLRQGRRGKATWSFSPFLRSVIDNVGSAIRHSPDHPSKLSKRGAIPHVYTSCAARKCSRHQQTATQKVKLPWQITSMTGKLFFKSRSKPMLIDSMELTQCSLWAELSWCSGWTGEHQLEEDDFLQGLPSDADITAVGTCSPIPGAWYDTDTQMDLQKHFVDDASERYHCVLWSHRLHDVVNAKTVCLFVTSHGYGDSPPKGGLHVILPQMSLHLVLTAAVLP